MTSKTIELLRKAREHLHLHAMEYKHPGQHDLIAQIDAELAAPEAPRQDEWPKLDKPAMVGCTRFSKGVSARTVVEAAQRNYEYEITPEKEAERIAKCSGFLEKLSAPLSPDHSGGGAGVVLPKPEIWRIPVSGNWFYGTKEQCEREYAEYTADFTAEDFDEDGPHKPEPLACLDKVKGLNQ